MSMSQMQIYIFQIEYHDMEKGGGGDVAIIVYATFNLNEYKSKLKIPNEARLCYLLLLLNYHINWSIYLYVVPQSTLPHYSIVLCGKPNNCQKYLANENLGNRTNVQTHVSIFYSDYINTRAQQQHSSNTFQRNDN